MKVQPERLARHLEGTLAPVYLVSGDEPLQSGEALDAIRRAARAQGCTERVVLHADARFDWMALREQADTLSLFGEQKLVELRLASASPDKTGAKTLADYAKRPGEGQTLLVSLPRLNGRQVKAVWYKALESIGVEVRVWDVEGRQLPEWAAARARRAGITLTTDAARLVAERSEGNLLACAQEIDKLALLHDAGAEVDAEAVLASVADSARFNAFDLVDSMLLGDVPRIARVTGALREEGHELLQVQGALLWALRTVHSLARGRARGASLDELLAEKRYGAWQRRRVPLQRALDRHPPGVWPAVLDSIARLDRMAKGVGQRGEPPATRTAGEAWSELLRIAIAVGGVKILPASL